MNIEWKQGLDDILTREVFWKAVFSYGMLVSAGLIFDAIVGDFFMISDSIFFISAALVFFHAAGIVVRRNHEKKAERLNELNIDDAALKDLEQFAEKYDYPLLDKRDLEALKRAGSEDEITWRDLWL